MIIAPQTFKINTIRSAYFIASEAVSIHRKRHRYDLNRIHNADSLARRGAMERKVLRVPSPKAPVPGRPNPHYNTPWCSPR